MAKALECPACGAKHRLDRLEPSPTFRCERCGQTLKVPTSVRSAAIEADTSVGSPASTGPGGGSTIAPPPRRRTPGTPPAHEVIAVSATVSATGSDGRVLHVRIVEADSRGFRAALVGFTGTGVSSRGSSRYRSAS